MPLTSFPSLLQAQHIPVSSLPMLSPLPWLPTELRGNLNAHQGLRSPEGPDPHEPCSPGMREALLSCPWNMAALTSSPTDLVCPLRHWAFSRQGQSPQPGLLPSEPQPHLPGPPPHWEFHEPHPRPEQGPWEVWMNEPQVGQARHWSR